MKTSVLIITKDRPLYLKSCLNSIKKQCILPDEVVVIDSSSTKESKSVCEKFKKCLNLVYIKEKKIGIAYARNTALNVARGDILAFIDDDCVAKEDWLEKILFQFANFPKSDVLLGRCMNYYPDNIYATVQQVYYEKWLMENLSNINKAQKVDPRGFCDFENIALKKSFIKDYRCSLDLPFGGFNEDIEMGYCFGKKEGFMYYPKMIVYHRHKTSFKELMARNFLKGYADEELFDKKGIEVRIKILNHSIFVWLKRFHKATIKFKNPLKKLFFWILLFIYPFFYKLGHLFYRINKFLKEKN